MSLFPTDEEILEGLKQKISTLKEENRKLKGLLQQNQLPKTDLVEIGKETEINGKKIIPILELCKSQIRRIFGINYEKYFEVKEILMENENHPDNFGVVAYYFDSRIGFTLNLKDDWKEFELSVDSDKMIINQLEMFDQLRAWGFAI